MEFIEISNLSYKDINIYISSFSEEELFSKENFPFIVDKLKKDERKNVIKLGISLENKYKRYLEEISRVKKMYELDRSYGSYKLIAGVDEVGRGPLAGPIVAAAVILKYDDLTSSSLILGLNDSKKLSFKKREELYDIIINRAEAYYISELDNNEIDEKGISFCNNKVFLEACSNLNVKPELVLTDGYAIKGYNGTTDYIVKGDAKSACIAAASIVAKVYRDRLMQGYSKVYPQYGFDKNVGYGTKEHIEAIRKYGITPIHRKSFLRTLLD
ncbi:Ribonuclease HII [Clostridium sp. N3C]|uniref:ribonuclease HII n=1 Tax=Clostridium sp. N3C TaxID=1776758 RepID=UPI00092E0056|nr:ribonuclease HII [Clostridium sp. N3C]SCN21950.1 Ribonuclease HII [Clostridium sp. N3C]